MQAALHQQLGVAGSHEFDRLLGSRMTVRNIDDFKAAEIQGEGLRDAADLVLGADENWLNKPRLCSLDRTLKRGLVAWVCDGGGKRRQRLRRRDETFIFFVLTRGCISVMAGRSSKLRLKEAALVASPGVSERVQSKSPLTFRSCARCCLASPDAGG